MSATNQQGKVLPRQEWDRLEEVIERFEEAWQRGQRPAIDDYLQPGDREPGKLLLELAHADLECRLKAGEGVCVETYFERYPEIAGDRQGALGLIAAEYSLRQRREPNLTPEDYERRFPQYREELPARLLPLRQRERPPSHLSCPHCHKAIALSESGREKELICSSCGGSFRFDLAHTPAWLPQALPRLDQFELLQEIGQGAFGTVYRARDADLGRIVAVKVPRSGRWLTPADQDRFVREARNAAQLSHPGIVPVYEVGRGAPVPYLVSAYVEGVTLAEALTRRRLGFREAAEVTAQVAEALDHAHRHGVVHRDLKPSNIMLGRVEGADTTVGKSVREEAAPTAGALPPENGAAGRAFVMDFGLSRRDEGEVTVTVEGQILGTPAYMSPEQARGESRRVDGRSDVYSLGVILYELLTGELPFRGVTRMVLQQIQNEEPRLPRRLNDKIPRDLETIALKCMAKETGRRYATAGEVAADLRRQLNGEPIQARPVSRVERCWRWSKRNPRVAGLSALVIALLWTVVLGSVLAAIQIGRERDAAVESGKRATAARHEAEDNAAFASRQLDLTLETLNKLVYEVQKKLWDKPDMLKLKESLLHTAIAGLQRVARTAEGASANQSMVSGYQRLGEIFFSLGDTREARKQFERSRALAEALSTADPENTKLKGLLSRSYSKSGEVILRQGDTATAEDRCRKAVELARAVVEADPSSSLAKQDLVGCYKTLGSVQIERAEIKAARESFRKAVEYAQVLVAADPRDTELKQTLASAYNDLGEANLRLGELAEARAVYQTVLGLHEAIVAAEPDSNQARRTLAFAYERLGDLSLRLQDAAAAQGYYQKSLERRVEVSQANPDNALSRRHVAVMHGKLGEAAEKLGDTQAAWEKYLQALKCFEELTAADRENADKRRDVAVAYTKLGDVCVRRGQVAEYREYYRKALDRFEKLAADNPDNARIKMDLGQVYGAAGVAEMRAQDYAKAAYLLERGVTLLRQLESLGKIKQQPIFEECLREHEQKLAVSKSAPKAIDDLDFALAQPSAQAIELLMIRATVLAGRGQHALAAATADRLRALGAKDFNALYNTACCYALCVPSVAKGKQPDQLTADEAAATARYAARAVEALDEAVRHGFKDVVQMESDLDLAPIRQEKGYQKVVERLKGAAQK